MSRLLLTLSPLTFMCLPHFCYGQTDVKVPGRVLAAMEFLVGTWETEGTFLGRDFKGSAKIRWAPGKHCLISSVKSNVMTATAVIGWDPTTNDIVETWYRTDGSRVEQRLSNFSESGWEGTSIVQDSSGKIMHGKIRVEKAPDGKSFTFAGGVDKETLLVGRYQRVEQDKK